MALRIECNREYLEKALDMAAGSATRAANQKGVNPMIRDLHLKDAQLFTDAKRSISEVK